MKRLLIVATALSALAGAPAAFAQAGPPPNQDRHDHGDHPGGPGPGQHEGPRPAAPQGSAAPAAPRPQAPAVRPGFNTPQGGPQGAAHEEHNFGGGWHNQGPQDRRRDDRGPQGERAPQSNAGPPNNGQPNGGRHDDRNGHAETWQGQRGPQDHGGQHGARPGPASHDERYRDRERFYRDLHAQRRFSHGAFHWPRGWSYRRWSYGETLPYLFLSQTYWLTDYYAFGLAPPPYGCEWIRYGDDALLVDERTGEIIQVVYGIFY